MACRTERDGGAERDHGIQLAREFARANGLALTVVQRTWSIGKAATLKRQARDFGGDVLFVLDGNTVLASPDYIERCVRELYQGVGIAAACGTVEPLCPSQRRALAATPAFQRWLDGDDLYLDPGASLGEQRASVEAQQLLLHHAPHEVGHVDCADTVALAALDAELRDVGLFDEGAGFGVDLILSGKSLVVVRLGDAGFGLRATFRDGVRTGRRGV